MPFITTGYRLSLCQLSDWILCSFYFHLMAIRIIWIKQLDLIWKYFCARCTFDEESLQRHFKTIHFPTINNYSRQFHHCENDSLFIFSKNLKQKELSNRLNMIGDKHTKDTHTMMYFFVLFVLHMLTLARNAWLTR